MSLGRSDKSTDFETGRYLYCVVRSDDQAEFEADGVEDEPVYLVHSDGLAAVVHHCESLYDADDMERVREWLLDHQAVVDSVGEQFGTPLPFRFDTILTGDDEAVRGWLDESREDLEAYLTEFAGHWEYRVEITRTDDPELEDERLAELDAEIENADDGTAFLLEKQRARRETDLHRARDDEIAADARERLEPLSSEFEQATDPDEVASFSLLAHEDDETAIGDELDPVAARDGIEVKFTGPWPPYSFAPEL
ncbi:gas vesicle protein GvpL [Halorussus halophilus]|uniref:gas vesicle protein GvpL n=1 Tax=Halorussus halophilus TaxID=2650975 RepID=UPI0017878260|nr:GvpL/GvpF family gas vesicle protein [Halorussus halophilus]